MSNTARNHHYIPQCYLRGFLDPILKKEQLHVIDKIDRRHFVTTPRNVGSQRDFNRVNVPGKPIDEAEKMFGEIDGEIARILKDVEENATLPEGVDMVTLFYFVALLHVHNPQLRNNIADFETRVIKQILRCLTANRERYESQMQRVRPANEQTPKYESVKHFVEEESFDLQYGHGHHLKYELESIDNVVSLLSQRKWSLFVAEEGASDFVCSDRPVALISIGDPPENPDHPYNIGGPGLAHSDTELTIPLNRRMALFAVLDGSSYIGTVDEMTIARVNERTICSATRQIYCSSLDFKFLANETIKDGRELVNE